jgi:hypothetical protein
MMMKLTEKDLENQGSMSKPMQQHFYEHLVADCICKMKEQFVTLHTLQPNKYAFRNFTKL